MREEEEEEEETSQKLKTKKAILQILSATLTHCYLFCMRAEQRKVFIICYQIRSGYQCLYLMSGQLWATLAG